MKEIAVIPSTDTRAYARMIILGRTVIVGIIIAMSNFFNILS